jgi:hypothetical protein
MVVEHPAGKGIDFSKVQEVSRRLNKNIVNGLDFILLYFFNKDKTT